MGFDINNLRAVLKVWRFKEDEFSCIRYLQNYNTFYESFTEDKEKALILDGRTEINIAIKLLEGTKSNRTIQVIYLD